MASVMCLDCQPFSGFRMHQLLSSFSGFGRCVRLLLAAAENAYRISDRKSESRIRLNILLLFF